MRRVFGTSIFCLPDRYWPVIERFDFRMSASVPLRDDLAAVHAGAGTDVDDVIGAANRFFVVLDDDDRVAEIAQMHERAQQPRVVALMQADRRFVEDVHHADESGADLAREADALRFAARQRVGAAIQRQIVQADVDEELQPRADLLQNLVGDFAAPARQFQSSRNSRTRSSTDRSLRFGNVVSPMKTLRDSSFSRVPPHAGQLRTVRYRARFSRTIVESVSR